MNGVQALQGLQARHTQELAASKEAANALLKEAQQRQVASQGRAVENATKLQQQLDILTARLHEEKAHSAKLGSTSKVRCY
jgi:hypothetical protein